MRCLGLRAGTAVARRAAQPCHASVGMGESWGVGHRRGRARTAARWELRLVGVVEVRAVGDPHEALNVGSRKARTLLALLGTRPGRIVATDAIVEGLWSARRPRRPEANVATLVSRLRARLGTDAVLGGRAGYRLGEAVRVDLDLAAGQVTRAEGLLHAGEPAASAVAAERVLDLLRRGPALVDHPEADWAGDARHEQAALLRRARIILAEALLRVGQPERARPVAAAAIAADPLDEGAYRLLMRACFAADEPAQAVLAYQRLRHTLAEELGTRPAPATHELYLSALRADQG
jgi:DNA-binding SARP family transcriptional activator